MERREFLGLVALAPFADTLLAATWEDERWDWYEKPDEQDQKLAKLKPIITPHELKKQVLSAPRLEQCLT